MARRTRRAPDGPLPARQLRSQDTLERLLNAAEEALRDDGPDGATLRAIAERAGVSVGIVYRRFPDKDTVLRAVYMRFFERIARVNEANLRDARWTAVPTAELAAMLIRAVAAGYVLHRRLLRALLVYALAHDDAEFQRRAKEASGAALEGAAQLFASRAVEISHPDPAAAIAFALRAVGAVLQQHLLFDPPGAMTTEKRDQLLAEVTRLFLSYLGIASDGKTRNPRRTRRSSNV